LCIAVLSAGIGFHVAKSRHKEADQPVMQVHPFKESHEFIGKLRPEFSLPDIKGKIRDVSEWDGNVVVINFWATWCPPCREEIPEFIKLQEKYADHGLQFIGIALQQAEDVREFVSMMGMNYPILVGEEEAIQVSSEYGNSIGALPYTAIVDRQSRIAFLKRGPLSRDAAEGVITSLF
jgi:thiol-disulfide isomerase/thioredoxin